MLDHSWSLIRQSMFIVCLSGLVVGCVPRPAASSVTSTQVPPTIRSTTPSPTASTSLVVATPTATTPPPTATTSLPTPTTGPSPTLQPTQVQAASALPPSVSAAAAQFRNTLGSAQATWPQHATQAQAALVKAVSAFATVPNFAAQKNLLDQFATALMPNPQTHVTVISAELAGNGQTDLVVAVPSPGLTPLLLPDGQKSPVALGPTMPDSTASDVRLVPLGQTGRSGVLVAWTTRGASAINTDVTVTAWDGSHQTTVLDRTISDWAGPASWQVLANGQIEFRYPAFGIYDHKLLPHPQQTTRYAWKDTSFALVYRFTDPPKTRREMMNLAEADFFAGRIPQALPHYQAVINDQSLSTGPNDKVDWQDFARFRLGEAAALMGDIAGANRWLSAAAKAPAPLGVEAQAFLTAFHTGGTVAGFAAIQSSDLPTLSSQGKMGDLDFPVTLGSFAALGEGVSYYLDHLPPSTTITATSVTGGLTSEGLKVSDVIVSDLNGDGNNEVAMVLPFGPTEQRLWLFVHQGSAWRAIAVGQAPRGLDGLQPLPGGRQAIRIKNLPGTSPTMSYLFWNGSRVGQANSPSATPVAIPVNFEPSVDGVVADDLGTPSST